LQHDILLLGEHDYVFAPAEGGEIGLGVFQLALVALGLVLEKLVGARCAMDCQVLFKVEVGGTCEDGDSAARISVGIFDDDDVGLV
jgi:hypothetical protein